jgi:inner membrane protein
MDPVAHTFTGLALAAAGLRRATPLAVAALVAGANVPDLDVFSGLFGDYAPIAFRRGWTHGVLALALWPFVLAGVLLAWDRHVRRRRDPAAAPARAGPLLTVSAIGVVTHPALDWLNNYGLRWLMPFDGRWFYGDAVFIIDPWLWLVLGGAAMLTFSKSRLARVRWAVFFALASVVIFVNAGLVPALSIVLWVAGLAALVAIRRRFSAASAVALERTAQAALVLAAVYIGALVAASGAARNDVRAVAAARGIEAVDVSLAPAPANPFRGDVVVMTEDHYYTGRFDWLATPRFVLDEERVARPRGALFEAAARERDARHYLVWARFPAIEVESAPGGGSIVRFFDMRYRAAGRIAGPAVRLAPADGHGGD